MPSEIIIMHTHIYQNVAIARLFHGPRGPRLDQKLENHEDVRIPHALDKLQICHLLLQIPQIWPHFSQIPS